MSTHRLRQPGRRRGAQGRRARRRGSVYLAVLGVCMIVTVVGMAGLFAVRIHRQAALASGEAVRARLIARSALDLALLEMHTNSDWRNDHAHDTWTSPRAIGDGEARFKFKLLIPDPEDAALVDDIEAPVQIVGEGTIGSARRMLSVIVDPPRQRLANGDMESGAAPWEGDAAYTGEVPPTVEATSTDPHAGDYALRVRNATAEGRGGVSQEVPAGIERGQTYHVEAWVRMNSDTDTVELALLTDSTGDGIESFSVTGAAGTSWTRISGTVTPTWTGELRLARLRVRPLSATEDFFVDDVLLRADRFPEPRPRSLRQEVE